MVDWLYRLLKLDTGWDFVFLDKNAIDIDGHSRNGALMSRLVGGKREYRLPTDSEMRQELHFPLASSGSEVEQSTWKGEPACIVLSKQIWRTTDQPYAKS